MNFNFDRPPQPTMSPEEIAKEEAAIAVARERIKAAAQEAAAGKIKEAGQHAENNSHERTESDFTWEGPGEYR